MSDVDVQHIERPEGLRVVELVCYCSNFEAARDFYTTRLGFKLSWQAEGFCGLEVTDQYRLSLVDAKYEEGWQAGQPVPPAQLSLQSDDLLASIQRIRSLGHGIADASGDPATNITTSLSSPDGQQIFIFQDSSGGELVVPGSAGQPYPFAEALVFVGDLPAAEQFYGDCFGLQPFIRQGDVYTALRSGGEAGAGLVVGLMRWEAWWDTPATGSKPAPARLAIECPGLGAEHARLSAVGAKPGELRGSSPGLSWFSVADPDGNLITYWEYASPAEAGS
ncbi:VOC family protein [bacterium]|nr:VOC family protein [bacterium]